MTTILTQIAQILAIPATTFHTGINQGRKAVKLACSLGASYDAAEILAPLKLATTASQIDEAYASPVKSCMQNRPVGDYYAQLGVQCLHSSNFRALVMPHPTTPGIWVTPRTYGVHALRVTRLLSSILIEDPDLFSLALPRDEWIEDDSTRVCTDRGEYEYTARYGSAYTEDLRGFAKAAGPFPSYGFEAPWLWERLQAEIDERFDIVRPRVVTVTSPIFLNRSRSLYLTDAAGFRHHFTAYLGKLTSKTIRFPKYETRGGLRLVSQIRLPKKVSFTPYPDYPHLSNETPLPAFHGVADLPDPWEDRAYAEEARFEGYRY